MDYCPIGDYFYDLLCEDYPEVDDRVTQTYEQWKEHTENIIAYVQTLPTHYEFLKEHIYKDETD